jgi:hypothetical protein
MLILMQKINNNSYILYLTEKISFYESPVDQFIKGGLDQTVICRASANPGPEIAWFRKGVNVEIKNGKFLVF